MRIIKGGAALKPMKRYYFFLKRLLHHVLIFCRNVASFPVALFTVVVLVFDDDTLATDVAVEESEEAALVEPPVPADPEVVLVAVAGEAVVGEL